ncbi:MAG: hypothetical protein K5927_06660 [Lachnospiraceae bacterium]|nr:hypothetical protein [Lachnospiraceae bacterium]
MTLFTSEHDPQKDLLINVAATIFTALFGGIYEVFSHEVYSYHMIYAFGIPLVLGVLVWAVLLTSDIKVSSAFANLWNSAIAVLTVGCVFRGVLEIYGTTNKLVIIYPVAGAMLIVAALAAESINNRKKAAAG